MSAPDVPTQDLQPERHRRPINPSVLLKAWGCLSNPQFLCSGGSGSRILFPLQFFCSPVTAAPSQPRVPGLLGEFEPDRGVFHMKIQKQSLKLLCMKEASSFPDAVLGSGRELHVQQLFPAAAFHLISPDCGLDLALVIVHNVLCGFLIREGENRPVPKANLLPKLGTSCWQCPLEPLIPLCSAGRPQPQPLLAARSLQANTGEQQCREAPWSAKKKRFY